MTPLTPPFSPADREAIRRRLMVDRPLHWDLARALFAALEAAWDELDRVGRAPITQREVGATRAGPVELSVSSQRQGAG